MKKIVYKISLGFILIAFSVSAGNEDRVGSAGASNLLINPWARSSALADAAYANTNGLEATYMNIAGLAFTDKTQIKFNHTNWMGSSAGIGINSAGIAQRISESSVIAISIQSMNYGDIPITTVANPEGNIGFFSPRSNIFSLGYARAFSSSIYAGINLKIISENISNLRTSGVALDAGIRYVTGENDKIEIAIAGQSGAVIPKLIARPFSRTMPPQSAYGGWMPRPKKLKPATNRKLKQKRKPNSEIMGGRAFGKISRRISHHSPSPRRRAAST